VGTEVLAVGDGVVKNIKQSNTVAGIDSNNLFLWNSIMLEMDDGVFVEYVHIKQNSCKVKEGERVQKGQVICLSGDIGFCPTPHLHIQMHLSDSDDAPTIKFSFLCPDGSSYFPVSNSYYNSSGPVPS